MIKFIKKFKSFFPSIVSTIIIIILSLYAIYNAVSGASIGSFTDFLAFLSAFFPIILVAISAIFLQLKKRYLPAHLVLLLGIISYADAGSNFVKALLSFSFTDFTFTINPFTVNMLVGLLIFLYLGLYTLSYVFTSEERPEVKSSPVWGSVILAFSYFYFRLGLQSAMIIILPAFIALLFGSQVATILLLIAGVVSVPFDVIIEIISGNILAQPVSYWIFTAFALLLLVLGVKGLIGLMRKKKA